MARVSHGYGIMISVSYFAVEVDVIRDIAVLFVKDEAFVNAL